jgi:hypothetical protein
MSVLSVFTFPAQLALPVIRPLFTLAGVAAVLASAASVFKQRNQPRDATHLYIERRTQRNILALNQMADELDTTQPSLAAELRLLAARG